MLDHLDLDAEDGDHDSKRAAIDDKTEASDHEPGEDEADDVVLPLGRQPAQCLLQDLQRRFQPLQQYLSLIHI